MTTTIKIHKIDKKQIKERFEIETGIHPNEIEEINDAYPASLTAHIHTENRTFNLKLTPNGKAKKGSFEEEK